MFQRLKVRSQSQSRGGGLPLRTTAKAKSSMVNESKSRNRSAAHQQNKAAKTFARALNSGAPPTTCGLFTSQQRGKEVAPTASASSTALPLLVLAHRPFASSNSAAAGAAEHFGGKIGGERERRENDRFAGRQVNARTLASSIELAPTRKQAIYNIYKSTRVFILLVLLRKK